MVDLALHAGLPQGPLMLRHEVIERASSPCCPTCGSQIALEAPLRVDLNTNTVTGYGIAMRVSPRHAEAIQVLADAYPRAVDKATLEGRLWGNTDISPHLLTTTLCFVRRKLEKFGFRIENVWNHGYRLLRK